jgi:hypothetical protein
MPSGRIEQQIDLRVTGLKDVKEAEKVVDNLDGTKAKVSVAVDAKKAQRTVGEVLKDVEKLGSEDATIVLAIRAAAVEQELTDILTDVATLDSGQATIDVELARAGELRGDLEQLQGKIKELNGLEVDVPTGRTKAGFDKVITGADQANSAVANMVGNSAQDLGELGGVTGSTGVAVGQLAEYFTDSAFAAKQAGQGFGEIVKSFAAAAAPIAGITLAVGTLTNLLAAQKAESEATAKRIEDFGSALDGAVDDAGALLDVLKEQPGLLREFNAAAEGFGGGIVEGLSDVARAVPVVGGLVGDAGEGLTDLIPILKAAGLSASEFATSVAGGGRVGDDFSKKLRAARESGKISEEQWLAVAQAVSKYGIEALKAKEVQDFLVTDADRLNKAYRDAADPAKTFASIQSDAADQLTRVDEIMGQAVEGTTAYNEALKGTDWGAAKLDGAIAGMAEFTEQQFALVGIAADTEEAFDNLGQSLKDNGHTFDVNTSQGRANQKALEEVARTLDTQLAAAYRDSGGDLDKFKGKAQTISDTLKTRLQRELGLSATEADKLIRQLGLTPKDIETRYKLSGTEEAKLKIGLLQTAIDNLPKNVQAQVTQRIIVGDYQGALAIVQGYYNSHPAAISTYATDPNNLASIASNISSHFRRNPVPITASLVGIPVLREHGGTVPGEGGIAGEAGPEFVALPDGRRMLLTGPTLVPPRTRVTSTRRTRQILAAAPVAPAAPAAAGATVNVKVQAAVIGNRFDVERAVRRATRDGLRLAGSRR